ncbi:MAG: patatin-like phospholipase family protein [Deltaproteobacteria bacterium]|nr:patatin-like phospholipase family protein [Deltaproteobacteria bacterium]
MGERELLLRPDQGGEPVTVLTEEHTDRILRRMEARTLDALCIDGRASVGLEEATLRRMLERLFPRQESRGLFPRARTLVLVDADAQGARGAFEAGSRRVSGVLAGASLEDTWAQLLGLCRGGPRGKVAVCLAGGGIEGLLYEVGVLRALDHVLDGQRVCDLDLFFGISAGSILAAFLANGLTPDQIAEGLRSGTHHLEAISRADLFDPNVKEFGRRWARMVWEALGQGEARNPLSAMYRAIPSAVFAGDRLRAWLSRQLQRPGMTDRFEETRRPLFIGATDQDTSEAVVFGEPGWTQVPIHRAVRASCALIPFFTPETIGGRRYIDGAFTRTTNMRVAVRHGATLCVLVDPLVPLRASEAGYVDARGGLFGAMQGLKGLIHGRFDKAAYTITEMFPDVAFHLFQPAGEELRILSGSPMKFLYRPEIEQIAYEHTLRKLRDAWPALQRDFARHGIALTDRRPRVVAEAFRDGQRTAP